VRAFWRGASAEAQPSRGVRRCNTTLALAILPAIGNLAASRRLDLGSYACPPPTMATSALHRLQTAQTVPLAAEIGDRNAAH
jgi:hypothetical protein